MDVKSAFMHEDIHEEIYMKHLEGYIYYPYFFCKLNRSLYGIKQAPREWYSKMDAFLVSQNLQRCKSDPNVYIQQYDGHFIIIFLYFDDLLITGSTVTSISIIKTALHNAFEMTDLGLLKQFLGSKLSKIMMGLWSLSTNKFWTCYSSLTWLNVGLHHSLSFKGSALKKEKAHLPWATLFINS